MSNALVWLLLQAFAPSPAALVAHHLSFSSPAIAQRFCPATPQQTLSKSFVLCQVIPATCKSLIAFAMVHSTVLGETVLL